MPCISSNAAKGLTLNALKEILDIYHIMYIMNIVFINLLNGGNLNAKRSYCEGSSRGFEEGF